MAKKSRVERVITKKENVEKKYKIDYNFDGYGYTYIWAENQDKAREIFENGDYDSDNEEKDYCEIQAIKEV